MTLSVDISGLIKQMCLDTLRAAGRTATRARLEALVNADVIGFEGAKRIWQDAFGGRLVGVKEGEVLT